MSAFIEHVSLIVSSAWMGRAAAADDPVGSRERAPARNVVRPLKLSISAVRTSPRR